MIKNFLNYSFFSVLNSALVFLNGLLLAKYTTIEVFGLISFYQVLIIGLSQLINFNTLGLVPITLSSSIRLSFDGYLKTIHSLMSAIFILTIFIIVILHFLNIFDLGLLSLMLLLILFMSSNDIDNSRLIGLGFSYNYGVALFITRILQSVLIFALGINDLLNIKSWLILVIFSEFFSLLFRRNFSLFRLYENLKFLFAPHSGVSVRYIMAYGFKYLPIFIFGYLYQYADRYFIKIIMTPSELGLFSYSLLLSSSVSIFATSLLNVFVPHIYKRNLISSAKILRTSFLVNLSAGACIIIILELLLPFISHLVGKPEIQSLSGIFFLTSIGVIFQGMYKIVGALLDANILYFQKFFSFFFAFLVNVAALYIFFFFSNANLLTFSIAFLLGNISLFMVSLYFILSHLKRNDRCVLSL